MNAREKAWRTRREKYGARGHNGAYLRGQSPCADCERMRATLLRLHAEGVLSEGQVARATGMNRVQVREWIDNANGKKVHANAPNHS